MVYTGVGSRVFFGSESLGYKLGDPSVDQNVPFNPMPSFTIPQPKYVNEEIRTFDQLEPKIVFSNFLEPGEEEMPPMVFRDPFLLSRLFTHKVKGGTWVSGTGTLLFDFTDVDDEETFWIRAKLKDKDASNDLERLLKGCEITNYKWILEAGMLLMEQPTIKAAAVSTNTTVMSCANSFHDQAWGSAIGGWALWDQSSPLAKKGRSVADLAVWWGGATIAGICISNGELNVDASKDGSQCIESLEQTKTWSSIREFTFNINGKLESLEQVLEGEKKYVNKTKQTLRIYYDTTVGAEKWLQFTNAYVDDWDVPDIPEAGESSDYSVTFKGGEDTALSYSGSFVNEADPAVLIKT
jgi:hypothetical protein